MINFIKKLIPIKVKYFLIENFFYESFERSANPVVFVFLAADYGNIGDIAITHAQIQFLQRTFPERKVLWVPISKTRTYIKSIKKTILKDDIVTIVGGGNMGVMYSDIEELRQKVIKNFNNNKIVCFPQTLDWEENLNANIALKKIRNIYSQHSDITLIARESVSLKKLNELFENTSVKVITTPDIVLQIDLEEFNYEMNRRREGGLLCLRNDKEKIVNLNMYVTEIQSILKEFNEIVACTDTHIECSNMSKIETTEVLSSKIDQFSKAKLIITDRLHGMILSFVTGTPCIVLPNSNHKISQTVKDWLFAEERIFLYENQTHIRNQIKYFIESRQESSGRLSEELYLPLIKALKNEY